MRSGAAVSDPSQQLSSGIPVVRRDLAKTSAVDVGGRFDRVDSKTLPLTATALPLAAHKRVDVALEALALVARARPALHVDVVGRGPEEATVAEAVRRLGMADRVSLHGFLPEPEKDLILARSTLNVCASDAEGWGQVVIAAAASGVPTVARDVPGLRDSVIDGHTGWLIPAGADADSVVTDLAAAVEVALVELSEPGRRAEVETACRAQAARYTWPAFHEQARAVVAEELAAAPRRPWWRRWRPPLPS
jgi:glycosyltransferase involved in cell wall biosynthesis